MSNDSLSDAILSAGKSITGDWKKAKKRQDRVSQSSLTKLRQWRLRPTSFKDAAFTVMEDAYRKASSNGRYYANARQLMYAARPLVLKLTDGRIWKDSSYFTQTLLKDYLEAYQPDWKIVWDARGHLHEPHTGHVVDLGGLKVMEYTNGWKYRFGIEPFLDASDQIETTGPALRYGTALFIEKEGFAPILDDAGISERYDLALVSSKGLPVAAACKLLRTLQDADVKILVMRDFDLAGFKIVRTLQRGVRLSVGVPNAIDMGFRLEDVDGLESEPVEYSQKLDPRVYLRTAGATDEEADFLVEGYRYGGWCGQRVELNAMTSEQHEKLRQQHELVGVGLPSSVRFSGLVGRFEDDVLPTLAPATRVSYPESLKPLSAFFVDQLGDPRLRDLHGPHFERYLAWRRTHGPKGEKRSIPVSNRTLEKDRAICHRMFNKAIKWGLVDSNPVSFTDKPKVEGRDPVLLEPHQLQRLYDACEDRPMLLAYVTLLAETGARCESEALWLTWDDVRLEEGFIWIDSSRDGHRTKTGKGRWVPITQALRPVLQDHFATYRFAQYGKPTKPSKWVFHHPTTRRNHIGGERVKSYRGAFSNARDEAKLPQGFRTHDLRHLRATRWLADGGDVVKVKEALGHSSLATTMIYTHLVRENLSDLPGVQPAEDEREALRELA